MSAVELRYGARPVDCECEQIVCVCEMLRQHKPECKFRKAVACPVGIECDCELKRDVCPVCDACDCDAEG